jgi:hypothetical protein
MGNPGLMARLVIVGIVVVVLAAAGCAASGDGEDPRLEGALAADLARRSDAVASLLDAGDGCAAKREAQALRRAVAQSGRAGSVPAVVRAEIDPVVAAILAGIECQPRPSSQEATFSSGTSGSEADEAAETENSDAEEDTDTNGNKKPKKDPHDNGRGNDDNKDED